MIRQLLRENLDRKKRLLGERVSGQLLFRKLYRSLEVLSDDDHEKLNALEDIVAHLPDELPIKENELRLHQNEILGFLRWVRKSYKLKTPFHYFSWCLGIGTFAGIAARFIISDSIHWMIIGMSLGILIGTLLDERARNTNTVL